MAAPLLGLKVIEMSVLGLAPFCAMLFADMGAEVLRIAHPSTAAKLDSFNMTGLGHEVVELVLHESTNVATVLRMVENADVLLMRRYVFHQRR